MNSVLVAWCRLRRYRRVTDLRCRHCCTRLLNPECIVNAIPLRRGVVGCSPRIAVALDAGCAERSWLKYNEILASSSTSPPRAARFGGLFHLPSRRAAAELYDGLWLYRVVPA
jgi:hypothetical protein